MYSIRTNGDSIAQEFSRLLGNNHGIKKEAQLAESVDNEALDGVEVEDSAEDFLSDANLSDMIVDAVDDDPNSASMVDDVIDNLETFSSSDPSGNYIMNGLGKIAGSLRAKGEAFAADVVEATALSIRGDLVKEAERKSGIVDTLSKMASDFSNNGDNFAADMVRVTISKIS
jgi:hypothetical protein